MNLPSNIDSHDVTLRDGMLDPRGFFDGRPFESEGTPLSRLMMQLTLILLLPRILHYFILQHVYQPRAVSEMISGLILGPSFLGKIPGWMPRLFPDFSMP